MKRVLTVCLLGFLSSLAVATPVKNAQQAVDLVIKSVEKNKLTTLKTECLLFLHGNAETYYQVDVREKHNEKCGGDPETAPRLFTYTVDKKTQKLCTDSIEWAEHLNADNPYDFICRSIK